MELVHLQTERCPVCEHPVSAVSTAALVVAIQSHVTYVNTVLDRRTDQHFEDVRLSALLLDV